MNTPKKTDGPLKKAQPRKTRIPRPTIEEHAKMAQAIKGFEQALNGFAHKYPQRSIQTRALCELESALENYKCQLHFACTQENNSPTNPYFGEGYMP
jgi:hypothetical protein